MSSFIFFPELTNFLIPHFCIKSGIGEGVGVTLTTVGVGVIVGVKVGMMVDVGVNVAVGEAVGATFVASVGVTIGETVNSKSGVGVNKTLGVTSIVGVKDADMVACSGVGVIVGLTNIPKEFVCASAGLIKYGTPGAIDMMVVEINNNMVKKVLPTHLILLGETLKSLKTLWAVLRAK